MVAVERIGTGILQCSILMRFSFSRTYAMVTSPRCRRPRPATVNHSATGRFPQQPEPPHWWQLLLLRRNADLVEHPRDGIAVFHVGAIALPQAAACALDLVELIASTTGLRSVEGLVESHFLADGFLVGQPHELVHENGLRLRRNHLRLLQRLA